MEPESPMKTEAGWKLWRRKPTHAPAIAAASTPASTRSSERAITAKVIAAIVHTPAARPSTPSVKFTTFITATRPSSVSGMPQLPRSSGSTNGSVMFSTRTSANTGIAAAANWPGELHGGDSPPSRASSTAPISAMAAAPGEDAARLVAPRQEEHARRASTPARIARPPRLGVGLSCRPRSRGRSIAPTR